MAQARKSVASSQQPAVSKASKDKSQDKTAKPAKVQKTTAKAKTSKTTKKATAEAKLIAEAAPETTETQAKKPAANKPQTAAKTGPKSSQTLAKSGKRSAKAIEQAEAKSAKQKRKAEGSEAEASEPAKPKQLSKPVRSRLSRRGKKFRAAAAKIDHSKIYNLPEAVALAAETSPVKFDASVELHIRLNVDPKQADQNVRGTLVLPSGSGKSVRVAAFVEPDEAAAAKSAGADVIGKDAIIAGLEKSQINFDVLISPPKLMPNLGKYARLLGPKGLMPNPKSGTVANDVIKAVSEAKAGKTEYRVDSTGIVHLAIGKVSFGSSKLLKNAEAVMASIKANQPSSVKSGYIKSAAITTSMGPSLAFSAD
ncbi:MAG: 50S ribosomal protein L1 [Candidatus Saccharimonadales bacterium]